MKLQKNAIEFELSSNIPIEIRIPGQNVPSVPTLIQFPITIASWKKRSQGISRLIPKRPFLIPSKDFFSLPLGFSASYAQISFPPSYLISPQGLSSNRPPAVPSAVIESRGKTLLFFLWEPFCSVFQMGGKGTFPGSDVCELRGIWTLSWAIPQVKV